MDEPLADARLKEEDLALRLERDGQISKLQRDSIWELHDLTKHGAKFIDIRVRKDGKEYLFEGDWLKQVLRHVLGTPDVSQRRPLGEACPVCTKPLGEDGVYRAGYEADNLRTIPARIGRGSYCDHIKKADALLQTNEVSGSSNNSFEKG